MRLSSVLAWSCLFLFSLSAPASAQEPPYFVTYSHYLEEPGNLEIALANTAGLPRHDQPSYNAPWLELEYGVKSY